MKQKIYLTIICTAIVLGIIYKSCTLPISLMIQGYEPFNYSIYKVMDYGDHKDKIIKVHNKDGSFAYIEFTKNKIGLWKEAAITISEACGVNDLYATLYYLTPEVENTEKDFHVYYMEHKLFAIQKAKGDIKFNFDNLPTDISYILTENEEEYIVELKSKRYLVDFPIEAFTNITILSKCIEE